MNARTEDLSLPLSMALKIDSVCDQFEQKWLGGEHLRIEEVLVGHSEPGRPALLRALLEIELELRDRDGKRLSKNEYLARFPDDMDLITQIFQERMSCHDEASGLNGDSSQTQPNTNTALPRNQFGRHRLVTEIGSGEFGTVYLAHDEQLQRSVAIKIPHRNRIYGPQDVDAYLSEARLVASLDHPHIVPVYDVGQTDEGLCYIVSKYIEGTNLRDVISQQRLSPTNAAELIAVLAQALHQAHMRGVVHRDVKPSNILIDSDGKPHIADFGLALKDEQFEPDRLYVGAPAYMSPEQARGEAHRVDGRSDIFSLGVVLYELLTGVRPFRGRGAPQVLDRIRTVEARPPRQIDDKIPKELERICLKALSKRATDRYTTALDMSEDLLEHVRTAKSETATTITSIGAAGLGGDLSDPKMKIVPKGLRSFDASDAEFFLELLPGPRDRNRIPESIRFWKSRIEETDTDKTFRVGLIYGPSGCGKSSLVKAGLVPRLASHVRVVHIEATSDTTEIQLRRAVQKCYPDLPVDLSLPGMVAEARRRGASDQKILIVLDQFEQWLHSHSESIDADLIQALRHCDGGRVQCLLMVRDDFWMAVTRFTRQLEIRFVEGENSTAVDLFDSLHARRVLTEFGRAYDRLPHEVDTLSREQSSFLDAAVAGLAEDGKVMPVRLALFAHMVRARPWLPDTLKALGGIEGIGVTYFEETFCGPGAPPECRAHASAARAVLGALLPQAGIEIKTLIRSRAELLRACGYDDTGDFDRLMNILEIETRLIAPVDPQIASSVQKDSKASIPEKHYQLTHDYLVPSLHDWLTRKQTETWRGRSAVRLAERAALWHAKPDNRYLPAWWELLNIRCLVPQRTWTSPQRTMIRRATRFHGLRGLLLLLVVGLAATAGWSIIVPRQNANQAAGLVQRLLDARIAEAPDIVAQLQPYRKWAGSELELVFNTSLNADHRQRAALALLADGNFDVVDYLVRRMLEAEPDEFSVMRNALDDHKRDLVEELWATAADPRNQPAQRFRAACALATYATTETAQWIKASSHVADELVAVSPVLIDRWIEVLRPVHHFLLPHLTKICRDPQRPELQRYLAAQVLAAYVRDELDVLVDLLVDSDPHQFAVLFSSLNHHQRVDDAIALLETVLRNRNLEPKGEIQQLAARQANAAVALLRMDQANEAAWSLMRHTPDPRARTFLIHRLNPYGVDATILASRVASMQEPSIRQALILSLGQFAPDELPAAQANQLMQTLLAAYQNDDDRAVHAAAEWLLRRWGHEERVSTIDLQLATGEAKGSRQWYVNRQGHTMVVLEAGEFQMGSPSTEDFRLIGQIRHTRKIGRKFAFATKEVTQVQFKRFLKDTGTSLDARTEFSPHLEGPQVSVNWYLATHYCNWLSDIEGIPKDQWCYRPNEFGQYAEGMRAAADFAERRGYRLPTESEWEFACRAGVATSRYYGDADELLSQYAWYDANSDDHARPAGQLMPNDFGLFDMHGNVWEWTSSDFHPYPQELDINSKDFVRVLDNGIRILRGGAWASPSNVVRSATRYVHTIYEPNPTHGFRVARTVGKSRKPS